MNHLGFPQYSHSVALSELPCLQYVQVHSVIVEAPLKFKLSELGDEKLVNKKITIAKKELMKTPNNCGTFEYDFF